MGTIKIESGWMIAHAISTTNRETREVIDSCYASRMKTKQCSSCKRQKRNRAIYVCRSCGAKCCEHFCGNKVGNEATCGACRMKKHF